MDRFFRGLTGGIAGGIAMNIWSLGSYYLFHFTNRRFIDWASVLLFGHLPLNFGETVFALIAQMMWAGFLGILFAYFIPMISSRGYLFKGAYWGFIQGFILYAIAILFKMPYFDKIIFNTAFSQMIGGVIWGITLAWTLGRLGKTEKVI